MCGVNLHSFCAAKAQQDPDAMEGELFSMACYHFSKIDGLTAEAARGE
jgi:hypothetical protein